MKRYSKEEIREIYNRPLLQLVFDAAELHRQHHTKNEVQVSSLVSIKTGGCPEDCAYCPQAARYHTDIKIHKLMSQAEVNEAAEKAKLAGASRVCLGAAWREVRDNSDFDRVLGMVQSINEKGLEVCCTLGMVTESQAKKLANAGLYAYNHNLDSSEDFYNEIITTRSFQDRLNTIKNVRKAGITVCSGGIIGMGESVEDRIGMLYTLSHLDPPPESVPINSLVPVKGTPLEGKSSADSWEMIRMVAAARIVMPNAAVRLSAGRLEMSTEAQALCFLAGANSIFSGEKLLTTPNPDAKSDQEMFSILGLKPAKPFTTQKSTAEVK